MKQCFSELYIDGVEEENHDWNTETRFGNVRVSNGTGSYVMAFDNQVTAKVSASFDLELMTVSMVIPGGMAGNLMGLMGTYRLASLLALIWYQMP